MSSNLPPGPAAGAPEPEFLSPSPKPAGNGRRNLLVATATVGVVGVIAAGTWGAMAFLSGGDQPAEAIPADAIGYVSLDLDPSAAQKIEAIRILQKFPALKKELDLDSGDDLRRYVFEKIQEDGGCKGVDYDADIEPWIGDRLAMAAVPVEGGKNKSSVAPLMALQVSDEEAAEEGLRKLYDCGEDGKQAKAQGDQAGDAGFGLAFHQGYALVSDSQANADQAADAVAAGSLADEPRFLEWTEAVGDPGIITMYVAPSAVDHLLDLSSALGPALRPGLTPGLSSGLVPGATPGLLAGGVVGAPSPDDSSAEALKKLYRDFDGMAAVVRFADGAVEAEFAASGVPSGMVPQPGQSTDVGDLPGSTALAFAVALPDGWMQTWLDQMSTVLPPGQSLDEMLAEAEAQTGLALPEDIEALLGDSVAVALDAELDAKALMQAGDPTAVPAGVRISGDTAEIMRVIDKLRALAGPASATVVVEEGEGVVAVGLDKDYVRRLVADGILGEDPAFTAVVPEADRANGVLYMNFDAGNGWLERLARDAGTAMGGPGDSIAKNVAPLDALGVSSWVDDDQVQHGLFRLTTD